MGFQKFGSSEQIIGTDKEDPQGISKQAASQDQQWTEQDSHELAQELPQSDEE
jgi:hypothetical protein